MTTTQTLTMDIQIREAKDNPMFEEWQRAMTVFLHYTKTVPCCHCGKKRKRHWTQLRFFHVMEEGTFVLTPSPKEYPPLSPVCVDHILQPLLPAQEAQAG